MPGTGIEIVRATDRRAPPSHALFDFDGTLSLLRQGWPEVMVAMMVGILLETGTDETEEALTALVGRFVMELNGKQTVYQMIRLAQEVRARGGRPADPLDYKRRYHAELMARVRHRHEAVRAGRIPPDDMLVPGSRELLTALRARGVELHLASGTDERFVREEARLLGLDVFFGPRMYGAVNDYRSYSKERVIRRILSEGGLEGSRLVGFGDGYVEVANVKAVGGTAVAVASDEVERSGRPDPWKRERLIGVGADVVVADYREHTALLAYLWGEGG